MMIINKQYLEGLVLAILEENPNGTYPYEIKSILCKTLNLSESTIYSVCNRLEKRQLAKTKTHVIQAIYGFIGENGSGKSTTEKLICGLLVPSGGTIRLFDRDYTDADVRARVGVLIEAPGCFSNYSVWNNMMLQAANLRIPNAEEEVRKVLKMVRMEGAASNKYQNCSLGMKLFPICMKTVFLWGKCKELRLVWKNTIWIL